MNCTVCNEEISAVRLRALPKADKCITCASANDVPLARRFDDTVGEDTMPGEVYIGPDTPAILHQKERLNNLAFGMWNDQEGCNHARSRGVRAARQYEVVSVGTQGDANDYAEKDGDGEVKCG